ncbi:MAG: hypothetical protein FWF92_07015 [Oscillospiraceae bacterium]|nr:hypothetical protein [Oscillospiraceae bacterium]
MGKIMVWVENWEMQCCGTPFKNGDCVKWEIAKCKDNFSKINEIKSDYYYDRHRTSAKLYEISGIVSNIQIVYTSFRLEYDGKKKIYTPISDKLVNLDGKADGWHKNLDEYKFCGYLVQLDYEKDLEILYDLG